MVESGSESAFLSDDIQERVERYMSGFTSPDEKKVEFTIEERDGVFVIFSRAYPIRKDGSGSAINFVAEKDTREEAEELIQRLKRL